MENRIKDPIMDNVDATKAQTVANASAISSIATLLATVWDFLQNRIGKVLNILNNSVIDRTLAVMNLATNIHNAAMLTCDIGETLGSVGVFSVCFGSRKLCFFGSPMAKSKYYLSFCYGSS